MISTWSFCSQINWINLFFKFNQNHFHGDFPMNFLFYDLDSLLFIRWKISFTMFFILFYVSFEGEFVMKVFFFFAKKRKEKRTQHYITLKWICLRIFWSMFLQFSITLVIWINWKDILFIKVNQIKGAGFNNINS